MRSIVAPLLQPSWFRLVILGVLIVSLQGCAAMKGSRDSSWFSTGPVVKDLERNRFSVGRGDDVVGRLAVVRLEKGDTLPDLARHFGVGINAISAANPGTDMWVPEAGEQVTLPLSFVLPDVPRRGIVINLATMRLFHYRGDGTSLVVSTYPVGIGAEDRPTPRGQTRIVRKTARPTWYVPASIAERHRKVGDILPASVPPGPDNPLGEYALYLGMAGYLIHGTNKPASIGLKATNGCMRLYPENIKMLFNDTPVNTPVAIVNQPYLIGQRNGMLYLEVHTPLEDSGADELQRMNEKLKSIEKKTSRTLDWQKIRDVQTEARGIPVPIFELTKGSEKGIPQTVEVEHPDRLNGKPEVPPMKMGAWYVLAAELSDELDARRMAAIINHQGPPIPARVVSKSRGYRVVAGPFKDIAEARGVVKRLKIDLEMDATLLDLAGK